MSLFQRSVLNKYLKEQDEQAIADAFVKFKSYFNDPVIQQNIRESKEEQFQEGFLRELFVKIFGYVINPNPDYNLTTEFKNLVGAKKADGAILKDGKAIGVIELKSTKTKDLESIRQQAFDYKAHHTTCTYVVTSNFEKLRFYINDAVEFAEFDLFMLSEERFQLLYLCLNSNNLFSDLPLKIKNASILEEEQITRKFYNDYSLFKKELFEDIASRNIGLQDVSKLLLYKKTQKLLDRFLFIFFAEDRGLLPPNSISRMIRRWNTLKDEDAYKPLYEIFNQYFGYLNKGRKGKVPADDIHEYNGGLFLPDVLLDQLEIDDAVLLKHTSILTNYDFESQVDVNILGHIFEHSLNEIESTTAELEGVDFDKQKSKRKKDGVYYTPKYITKYIVDNTVGKLCEEKKAELGMVDEDYVPNRQKDTKKKLLAKLETYRNWLLKLTICDPACGSGAFLNQALEFLIKEHHYVDELHAKLFDSPMVFQDVENQILERNLFGVDINEESVEIARLSLWLRTAQRGRKLTTLNKNIKCGNSLIDDPEVAGDKAFNWSKEFPEIFAKGGFDVVIGNPPYVRAELLGDFREYLEKNYSVYNPSGDLFSYFYEKSFKLLKNNGSFGFISNTFDKTTAGISLREYLQNEVKMIKYIDFKEVQIFEGATTYPIIFIANNQKVANHSFTYINIPKSSQSIVIDIDFHASVLVSQNLLDKENWGFKSNQTVGVISKLKRNKAIRDIYGKSYRGIITGLNDAFIIPKTFPVGKHIKPIFEGRELAKWTTPECTQQLIIFESKWTREKYGTDITESIALESVKREFPELLNHILPYEERARKRYDQGDFFWELRNCAYYDLFDKPKIVFPNLQNSNKFAFDETGAYINAPAVILPTTDKFITAILNSRLTWFFLTNICVVRNGGYIEVKPQYFEQIPIPELSEATKKELEVVTNQIISKVSDKYKVQGQFLKLLESKFCDLKLTKKLQHWYDLEFGDFLKELKKAKLQLSLSEEAEWMAYFNEQKQKAQEMKSEINRIDHEIDHMVYELYGLTEEEIGIVEGE